MFALTKKTGYGLIAMAHLAHLTEGQVASAREIAERFDIPSALLMNVLKEMGSAGYVESVRGARGGYRLACDPAKVSLAEVVAAMEGPIRLAECIADPDADEQECTCQVMDQCPIADPVHRVHRRIRDFLSTVTLAEIVEPSSLAGTLSDRNAKEPAHGA